MASDVLIRMENITKEFGTLRANDGASLSVRSGEIHAVLGENGAGKSTLMNILAGIYTPDGGTVSIAGKPVRFASPHESILMGIGMIHQHFKLVESMTTWQNICAGPDGEQLLRTRLIKDRIRAISTESGLDIDLDKPVAGMGVGEKQTVEIVRMLYRGADVLILDEPTSVLTPQETERLFTILRKMRNSGKTAIIITHKLNEVMTISDRVTVLRKGRTVSTVDTAAVQPGLLAEMMVGESTPLDFSFRRVPRGEPVMRVSNLCIDDAGLRRLSKVSFDLHRGEILGIAGVSGSGQKQLCMAIAGLQRVSEGRICMGEHDTTDLGPRQIGQLPDIEFAYVPEDRLGMGLVGTMSMVENILLRSYRSGRQRLLDRKEAVRKTEKLVETLEVMHPGIEKPISVLSGGNLQKILIGREIAVEPDILVAAYPVRGLDLGVSHRVVNLLNDQKARGAGVLLIAEDLDLLMELSDRILVLHCGVVSGIVEREDACREKLGMMMASIEEACSDD